MPLRYAGDPLGKRRPIVAQRFNLAGGARVLYLAEDQVTSLHEIQAFGGCQRRRLLCLSNLT